MRPAAAKCAILVIVLCQLPACGPAQAQIPIRSRHPLTQLRVSPRPAARGRLAFRGCGAGDSTRSKTTPGAPPPEPQGYRTENYRAPTPLSLTGATVLDTAAAHRLWQAGAAVWIDVLAAPHRPASLPAAAVWLPVPRRDIPGSVWLPDIGRGDLNPELEAYFRANLARLTKGRLETPVIFYCLANCWMSWNAAKRAAKWGYRRIYWYRDGTDGWQAAKLPLARVRPVPGP
jgi:PQQ-dependent catabolism-associated CXXCW motif protein